MMYDQNRRKPEKFLGVITAGSLAKGVEARFGPSRRLKKSRPASSWRSSAKASAFSASLLM